EYEKIGSNNFIAKGSIQETMIGPLWARATLSQKYPDVLKDPKAVEILTKIDYNFSELKEFLGEWRGIGLLVRAHDLDNAVKDYIKDHPKATVINVGAGLDTTFQRVDNEKIIWYDLDLPDAIDFRKKFIPETSRSKYLSRSAFDLEWLNEVEYEQEKGIFFIAGGFIYYYSEEEISTLFRILAERFPGGGIVFDCVNKIATKVVNRRAKKYDSELSFSLPIGNTEKSILKWSDKLRIKEWYTMYSRIPINPKWHKKTRKMIKISRLFNIAKIVVLEFLK
ncbi:MAG: class I SAM-dependent methyltransferase, partial [Promethearchaeota archaeon]